ncbi:mobile mystery protein B [Candidatus Babeliales bacterium]|nr:mobile mystery protein B [Candidatus Babeliales bacterium]
MKNFNIPEGATPIDDYSGLLPKGVHTQKDLNRVEAENILTAQKKYLKKRIDNPANWFNVENLKAIHKAMFCDVWAWAGSFRKSNTSIGIEPYKIPSSLGELCIDIAFWTHNPISLTFLEQAARIHHRLVFIHPFENGNGRFSRLVADRYLVAYGCPYPQWPYLQDDGQLRTRYIQSLREADQGDFEPLVNLMRTFEARDPYLSELLGLSLYKKSLSTEQKLALINALLRAGHKINETKNNGYHPLNLAIKQNLQDIARILIKHGANIKFRDKSGYDPFELAINNGFFDCAKILCNAGYPYIPNTPPSSKIKIAMLDKFEKEFSTV